MLCKAMHGCVGLCVAMWDYEGLCRAMCELVSVSE